MNQNSNTSTNDYQMYDPNVFGDYSSNFTEGFYGNQQPSQQSQVAQPQQQLPAASQEYLRVPSPFEPYMSDSSYGSGVNEEDSRKKRRNMQEKKRREQLNLAIDSFRDLIPPEIVYNLTKDTSKMNDKISRHQLVDCTRQYIDILRQTVFEQNQFLMQHQLSCPISSPIEIDAMIGRKKRPLQSLDRLQPPKSPRLDSAHHTPAVSVTTSLENLQVNHPVSPDALSPVISPDGIVIQQPEVQISQPKLAIPFNDQSTVANLITRLNDNLRVMYMMLRDTPDMSYWIRKSIERCQDITKDVLEYHSHRNMPQ
eukprot:NODE_68_length_23780_cov_0.251003.p7 type:complete len:311 gc:universal NODE_68_length_23780_cov_0.251003:227-1159(+)